MVKKETTADNAHQAEDAHLCWLHNYATLKAFLNVAVEFECSQKSVTYGIGWTLALGIKTDKEPFAPSKERKTDCAYWPPSSLTAPARKYLLCLHYRQPKSGMLQYKEKDEKL